MRKTTPALTGLLLLPLLACASQREAEEAADTGAAAARAELPEVRYYVIADT